MPVLMLWGIAYSLFSTDLGMGHECAPAFSGRLLFRCAPCSNVRRDGEGRLAQVDVWGCGAIRAPLTVAPSLQSNEITEGADHAFLVGP